MTAPTTLQWLSYAFAMENKMLCQSDYVQMAKTKAYTALVLLLKLVSFTGSLKTKIHSQDL